MDTTDPVSAALRALSTMSAAAPGIGGSDVAALNMLLMQAHWVASAALGRSAQRGAQSWLDYGKEAAAPADGAVRVDAARAHLRRLAEIAADEAHEAARQLQAIDEQVRALIAPADDGAPPVRRAQAKP